MIPLCDLVPSRTRPVATLGLAALSAAGSVVLWFIVADAASPPARLGLAPVTWSWPGAVAALAAHQHLDTLIANVLALWLFGPTVEDRLGRGRFVALWAASGLAAVAAQIAATPYSTSMLLGSVGATAGVIAANITLHRRGRILAVTPVIVGFEFVDLPAWLYAAVWLSVLPLTTLAPFAGLLGATGAGAVVGAVVAALARHSERMRIEWWAP